MVRQIGGGADTEKDRQPVDPPLALGAQGIGERRNRTETAARRDDNSLARDRHGASPDRSYSLKAANHRAQVETLAPLDPEPRRA